MPHDWQKVVAMVQKAMSQLFYFPTSVIMKMSWWCLKMLKASPSVRLHRMTENFNISSPNQYKPRFGCFILSVWHVTKCKNKCLCTQPFFLLLRNNKTEMSFISVIIFKISILCSNRTQWEAMMMLILSETDRRTIKSNPQCPLIWPFCRFSDRHHKSWTLNQTPTSSQPVNSAAVFPWLKSMILLW